MDHWAGCGGAETNIHITALGELGLAGQTDHNLAVWATPGLP